MRKLACRLGIHEWVVTDEIRFERTFRCLWCFKFIVCTNVMHPNYAKEPRHYVLPEDLGDDLTKLSPQLQLLLSKNLKQFIEIASIPTENYKEVIEVRVPTRFYWNKDGSFDGIEFGEFKRDLLPWQEDMIRRCLEAIVPAMSSTSLEEEKG